jgi:hypothetical protein
MQIPEIPAPIITTEAVLGEAPASKRVGVGLDCVMVSMVDNLK